MKILKFLSIIGNLALFFAFVFILINTVQESEIISKWVTIPLLSVGIVGDACQVVIRLILTKREREKK